MSGNGVAPNTVVAIADPALTAFIERGPGRAKRVLREEAAFQLSIYRLGPGGRIPAHSHTRSHDIFVGVDGRVRIESRPDGHAVEFMLAPGGVCTVPPGVSHELVNPDPERPAVFVLVHAPYDGFDHLPDASSGGPFVQAPGATGSKAPS